MPKTVLIGIQARSGSTRLPRKAFELIGGKMMLDHVIESCKKAAQYVGKRDKIAAKVVVLTPDDDPIVKVFSGRCDIVQGPCQDVLSRYLVAHDRFSPDIMVRITGDCPLIPHYVISRVIALAAQNEYDYIGNGDERFRTSMDGIDCEAISARLLATTAAQAKDPYDREHVTSWMRRETPEWAKVGAVLNYFDHSDLKLSVDTPEDLARVRIAYDLAADKYHQAIRAFGQHQVHIL